MPDFTFVQRAQTAYDGWRHEFESDANFQRVLDILDQKDREIEDRITTMDISARVIAWAAPLTAGIPRGWLYCNGQAVSRSAYANLFHTIGTTYGSGDGSTTFNVPNLTLGRVIAGYESSLTNFDAIGETGGSIASNHPAHDHSPTGNGLTGAAGAFNVGHDQNHQVVGGATNSVEPPNHTHGSTGPPSINHTHNIISVHLNDGILGNWAGGAQRNAFSGTWHGFTHATDGTSTNHSHTTAGVSNSIAHAHSVNNHGHAAHSNHSVSSHTHILTSAGGSGNNLPPYITMRFLIRI